MNLFKKKKQTVPTIIETSIGKISQDTLKHNPQIIKDAFKKEIEHLDSEIVTIYERVIKCIEDTILQNYGKWGTSKNDKYFYCYQHTAKSRKLFNKYKNSLFKKEEVLDKIDARTELLDEMKKLGL